MIKFLLNLLEQPMEKIESPGSVKAQIVEAIKAMLNSLQHLTQVEGLLNQSRIWRDYKDQNHDLFIEKPKNILALGGNGPGVAGKIECLFYSFFHGLPFKMIFFVALRLSHRWKIKNSSRH